jgi:hypothetical protein
MMSVGSEGADVSSTQLNDDYVPDLGGQAKYLSVLVHFHFCARDAMCSVEMPDGGNPLSQEEQSEYLLWKNVFSAVRHGRRNEVHRRFACVHSEVQSNSSGYFVT